MRLRTCAAYGFGLRREGEPCQGGRVDIDKHMSELLHRIAADAKCCPSTVSIEYSKGPDDDYLRGDEAPDEALVFDPMWDEPDVCRYMTDEECAALHAGPDYRGLVSYVRSLRSRVEAGL